MPLLCVASMTACKGPPVIDVGTYVSIASDNPNAVCEGAALALDRLVAYQASLLDTSLIGFSVTVYMVTDDELESRCGSRDALGCVREKGSEVWIGESTTAPYFLARAVVRQQIGSLDHDFIAWGTAEAISGASSYPPRYHSDADLPTNLASIGSRPGLAPLAGNYVSQLMRSDPETYLQLLRDAKGESGGRIETLFNETYGLSLYDDVSAWVQLETPACSLGVSPCSGLELPWDSLAPWNPLVATCADGRVFDLGVERTWTTVQLPDVTACSIRAETQVQVYACGACDQRFSQWSVEPTPGQWHTIEGLPGGERIAIETRRKDGGEVSLSCAGQP